MNKIIIWRIKKKAPVQRYVREEERDANISLNMGWSKGGCRRWPECKNLCLFMTVYPQLHFYPSWCCETIEVIQSPTLHFSLYIDICCPWMDLPLAILLLTPCYLYFKSPLLFFASQIFPSPVCVRMWL